MYSVDLVERRMAMAHTLFREVPEDDEEAEDEDENDDDREEDEEDGDGYSE